MRSSFGGYLGVNVSRAAGVAIRLAQHDDEKAEQGKHPKENEASYAIGDRVVNEDVKPGETGEAVGTLVAAVLCAKNSFASKRRCVHVICR